MATEGQPLIEINAAPMNWVWIGVFAFVTVVGGLLTPWEALAHLLESGGVGAEGTSVLGFVAGYTLPLFVGLFVCFSLVLNLDQESMRGPPPLIVGALILAASGWLASKLGLGLVPEYDDSGPWGLYGIPVWVFLGYFNAYGWTLMLCSAAIAGAAALQVRTWLVASSGAG